MRGSLYEGTSRSKLWLRVISPTFSIVIFCFFFPLSTLGTRNRAQSTDTSTACSAPEYRQFDFWLGSWTVKDGTGKEVGKSEITRVSNGCAIREQWSGGNAINGTSLNYFDKKDGNWHQNWVGGGGLILHLSGGLQGKIMVLTAERQTPQGQVRDQISWTPLPDGRVLQEWKLSTDGGKSWKSSFAGYYVRQ